jgi:LDH2 family malate/lactate/ureidoglycolate dehydrogenase
MSNTTIYIPQNTLHDFIHDVFISLGVPADDAETCTKVIIASDLRGIESHGIGRLKYYYDRIKSGQHQVKTRLEIVRESSTTAVIDGHHGMGMVIGTFAMNKAIEKAKNFGMGSVAVRNSTHFGIAGYYSSLAVNAGMMGICMTNARPSVSPTFGIQPMLGTNPIAFAAPSDEDYPFLFDAATPIIQRGKIEVLSREEKTAREGWVVDENNQNLINPDDILKKLTNGSAALLPLGGEGESYGGHKGYGLGSMVEILCASLQTGAFLTHLTGISQEGTLQPFKVGHFFMAINIEDFLPLEEFKSTTGQILRELRASAKPPGYHRIYTAGEKEFENEKVVRARGIPINPNLQREIETIQKDLGLTQYKFPF